MKKRNICRGVSVVIALTLLSCSQSTQSQKLGSAQKRSEVLSGLSDEFRSYWYDNKAEITTYNLEQARYGEVRKGHATLIFVTEDFQPKSQVKADNPDEESVPVLKLNATKKFATGIYPYSIMQSTFFPVANSGHALKVSASIQEWCGQTYIQMNNRSQWDVTGFSYFESEGDQSYSVPKVFTENELFTQLRIDPKSLPTGNFECIPSLDFCRLKHIEVKPYPAEGSLLKEGVGYTYVMDIPDILRKLVISFHDTFPYEIEAWREIYVSGFGNSAKQITTVARKKKQIRSPYWTQNSTQYSPLRDSIGLPPY